ncbi:PDDEXK nuclease domain-containing protein [Haliscomenobacter hydrossis]|uniref:Cytoplasmic protein n=1 Tax=Haliscomenobacter hydrossis (strain ATCC 27775 / DSM 1100 / LMG 10767 / O) TaxID=760192 RepID=F4L2L4_HALH1|nr:PDDEXK nuclease domain-containing protein [Haliscomenobacter hydrossis]AEE53932.1 protein of unknown function DUF1016 [Haliscomenobacter hydrossis DSM 1100]
MNINQIDNLKTELPKLFHVQPPLGVSPTLYRNWCLGRVIHQAFRALPDQAGFFERVNALLAGTPVQGMAAILERFYHWYPSENSLRPGLSWAHFQALLGLYNASVRDFYLRCAQTRHWTAGQLKRQIQTDWHLRLSQPPDPLFTSADRLPNWLPNPLVLEFAPSLVFSDEAELETAIVDHLEVFLLELGQGLSFVARQMRLTSFSGLQMVIDLVFYHHRQRHFVLFELKNVPLSAAAIGQMQSYLQLFDDCWKNPEDAPSVGVILCTDVDPALQRYSALYQNPYLYAVAFTG